MNDSLKSVSAVVPDQMGPDDLEEYFKRLRFHKAFHLGLGEIRLSLGQQEEIVAALKGGAMKKPAKVPASVGKFSFRNDNIGLTLNFDYYNDRVVVTLSEKIDSGGQSHKRFELSKTEANALAEWLKSAT